MPTHIDDCTLDLLFGARRTNIRLHGCHLKTSKVMWGKNLCTTYPRHIQQKHKSERKPSPTKNKTPFVKKTRCTISLAIYSLPKTKSSPLKMGFLPKNKVRRLPTIIFRVLYLLDLISFREAKCFFSSTPGLQQMKKDDIRFSNVLPSCYRIL